MDAETTEPPLDELREKAPRLNRAEEVRLELPVTPIEER